MKIEAVITCVNYSDFLAHTLPQNLQHLDRVVVVTHPEDRDTQRLCQRYGVDCLPTLLMHEGGDKFNKGRLINLGLAHLRHTDWLLHLDADVLLPHKFRAMLEHAKLDRQKLYGADRLNTLSYEHFQKHHKPHEPQHQWRYMVTPQSEFPLGSRLMHQEYGYCPIGYFQLWHSLTRRSYPIISGSAEHSDVLFAIQWPREERLLLPELFVYHLESEQSPMGHNWEGRKSKPFCAEKSESKHEPKHHKHSCRSYKPPCDWQLHEPGKKPRS